MKETGKTHSVDTVFVLSLFCVFAACVLLTLMLGVKTHTAMKASADEAYYSRTALSYITEKLRHVDAAGCAEIGTFSGESALILHESYNGADYTTTIYLYDGKICELFCEAELELDPKAGSPVIEAGALSFKAEGNLITISYTDPDGRQSQASVALRSGGNAQ